MTTRCSVLVAWMGVAACSSRGTPTTMPDTSSIDSPIDTTTDSPTPAMPEGTWDLTLVWNPGICAGLARYHINFSISDGPGHSYILTPGVGLTGDDIGGTLTCTTMCRLDLTVMGAGGPAPNVTQQTIHATIDEDANKNLAGGGTAQLDFNDGTSCSSSFDATGAVI